MIKDIELKFLILTLFLSILGTLIQSFYTYDGFHCDHIAQSKF